MMVVAIPVLAHLVGGGWAPETDDRLWVDQGAGLFLVAGGSGPTYGGYHAPYGLDPGLDAIREAFSISREREPGRLLGAVAAGHSVMRGMAAELERAGERERSRTPGDRLGAALRAADSVRPQRWRHLRSHCHFGGEITACHLDERGELCVVQVGGGRAYLQRQGRVRVLVPDHTLPTEMSIAARKRGVPVDPGISRAHRHVVTRLLGLTDPLQPAHAREQLSPGDVVLLCTEGVWNDDDGERRVSNLFDAGVDELRAILDSVAREHRRDGAVVRFSVVEGVSQR